MALGDFQLWVGGGEASTMTDTCHSLLGDFQLLPVACSDLSGVYCISCQRQTRDGVSLCVGRHIAGRR